MLTHRVNHWSRLQPVPVGRPRPGIRKSEFLKWDIKILFRMIPA